MTHIILNIVVFLLGCWGSISLILKKKIGFAVFFVQNIFWAVLSIVDHSYGGAGVCIFMAALDVYGWYQWSKDLGASGTELTQSRSKAS